LPTSGGKGDRRRRGQWTYSTVAQAVLVRRTQVGAVVCCRARAARGVVADTDCSDPAPRALEQPSRGSIPDWRDVRGIQTCQHRTGRGRGVCPTRVFGHASIRSRPAEGTAAGIGVRPAPANTHYLGAHDRWTDRSSVCNAGIFRHACIRNRPAHGTAAGIGIRHVSAKAGYRGARDEWTDPSGVCTVSVFRHARIRSRPAHGTAAGIWIRHEPAHASQHGATDGRTDRRPVFLPTVRCRSTVRSAHGTAAGIWIRYVSARADRHGARKGQADTAVRAASVFRHAGIRRRRADAAAAGTCTRQVPIHARDRGARDRRTPCRAAGGWRAASYRHATGSASRDSACADRAGRSATDDAACLAALCPFSTASTTYRRVQT